MKFGRDLETSLGIRVLALVVVAGFSCRRPCPPPPDTWTTQHMMQKGEQHKATILILHIKLLYSSTYPGRQCWSLPPMRTMFMFGLVKHRHSPCWCLTPLKKSMDLGSAMKCKIIIHIFIIPISQRVRVLGTEFETYKILRLLNFRTGNKSINNICKYLHFYCQSSRTKHGTLNGLEICRSQKLMSQIDMNYNI